MIPPWDVPLLGDLLWPLSQLYGLGLKARERLYGLGLLKEEGLPVPVVSVGNLTVGGSGKTPMVMALAKYFRGRGFKVAILSRGYKGRAEARGAVVSDGQRILRGVEESGDEPQVLARALHGVMIAVGKDRLRMGQLVCQHFQPDLILLDDGFQYRGLKRDLDLLCLDLDTDLERPRLLPAGPFREPLSAIGRATAVILTYWRPSEKGERLREKALSWGKPLFLAPVRYEGLVRGGELFPLSTLRGKKVSVLLGIAKPWRFLEALRGEGIEVLRVVIRGDHHWWEEREIGEAIKGAEAILTTEKDLVKLPDLDLPCYALRMSLEPEEAFWGFLESRLSG